jgi:hypothetical protein
MSMYVIDLLKNIAAGNNAEVQQYLAKAKDTVLFNISDSIHEALEAVEDQPDRDELCQTLVVLGALLKAEMQNRLGQSSN